jgi:hypothetical protein
MANGRGTKDPDQGPPEGHKYPPTREPSTANRRGAKDPTQGPTLVHQRATSTQQQETPQWPMGGATKTQLKAQYGPTGGPQAPNNKRPLNGQWEGRQRPNLRPNTDPPEGHKHPTTRDPSMANGRGDKDPTQGPILTHRRATSTQQQETPQWPMGGATKTQIKAQH